MAGHYRTPRSRWGDAALALFVLFVDALACLTAAVWLWAAHVPVEGVLWALLALAVLVVASAFAFGGRAGLPVTAGVQVVAGFALGLLVLASYAASHRGH
ncbi:hypothetical protein V2W30_16010 [Streptomyces sp. Q6]|uniref:Uncharacterized protein n=1 Tax=Streptomyces citrinus TaxID=3118173 RepID=A0ACD5ACS1_9ACTN